MPRFAFTAALLAAAQALAQVPGEAAPDAGVLTKPPALLRQVEAQFPPEALDAGIAGSVSMEVDLGVDGKVTQARVVQSAGHGFDEAALAAVRQFEFSPAEVDGQPAPVRILYTYEFVWRPQVVVAPEPDGGLVNFIGTLLERGTRDPLAGGSVVVRTDGGDLEAISDEEGRFEMAGVPPGTWPVLATVPDHLRYEETETFRPGKGAQVTYYVRKKFYGIFETVVRAQRERKDVSEVTLRQEEIRLIPGTQGDAFKVVQNLPGVARAAYGLGFLVVRGGAPWDTRVYVDDVLVPLLFHFGGLFATYNANLLQDLSFVPGNFQVDYGRSTGGLVRGESRTPSEKGIHGYADVNLVDASALVEAPVGPNWSVAASARRSYIDATLPFVLGLFVPSVSDTLGFTTAPRYYDYQLKAERHVPGSADRLMVEFFGSDDKLGLVLKNPAYDPEGRGNFDASLHYDRLAVNWDHRLASGLRFSSHNSLGFDQNGTSFGGDVFFNVTGYPMSSRDSLTWELPPLNLTLEAGTDVFFLPFHYVAEAPPPFKLNEIPDPFVSRSLIYEALTQRTVEPALFLDAVWKAGAFKVVPGIRGDFDTLMSKGWVDPRLSAFWTLLPKTTLKAGWGLFHQPPDYRRGYLSPKFGNPDLLPEGAIHYSAGLEQALTDDIRLDLTAYYKSQFHLAQPTLAGAPGTDASQIQPPFVSTGVGRSYGVEVLLRHQLTRNFFGWISYSLSRSEITYFNGDPQLRLNPFDQTHNLVVIASYKLPHDFIAGVRVRYTTGPLTTRFIGGIFDNNGNYFYPVFKDLFGWRLPPFFELDARIDKRFVFDKWMLAVYLDVQNATNRQNAESVIYNFDYTQSAPLPGLPILPSLGVRAEL